MRIYRAKSTLSGPAVNENPGNFIYKGQLFFVDNYTDLPCYNGEKEVDQNWDELKLYNNYGTIQLVGKNP